MSKINKLTKVQEQKMPIYLKKWLDNGYSTKPLNREKTAQSIKWLYEFKNLNAPTLWFCESPLQVQLIINLLKNDLINLMPNLRDNLWTNLSANLWDNLGNNLSDNLRDNLGTNLRNNLCDNLWDNLRDNLGPNLRDNLWTNLRDNLWNKKLKFEYFLSPAFESSWVAFYDFVLNEIFPERKEKFSVFNSECIDFYMNTFLIVPFHNICFISERPTEIHKLQVGSRYVLHNDGGPCMKFRDDYDFHCLNGIRVSKEIAETPGNLLNSDLIINTKNADVRREIVRKIGNEKICSDLNAICVDKSADGMYELLQLDLKDGRKRPFLKMINPSIGIYHIEGVHPDCKSVNEALNFRNGTTLQPTKLT